MANLSDIERQYYARKVTGATPQTPFGQLKKEFLASQVGEGRYWPNQMRNWLRKLVNDNGGTPRGNNTSDLLKQALAALGIAQSTSINENMRNLFINLP